jgi:hypothetical protein
VVNDFAALVTQSSVSFLDNFLPCRPKRNNLILIVLIIVMAGSESASKMDTKDQSVYVSEVADLHRSGVSLDSIAVDAAGSGLSKVIEWCYDQGWSHPSVSYNGQFYLFAMEGASTAVFQVLLDHGFDLNAHENEACGDALASAIRAGNYGFARWLLEHGHRATPQDAYHGESALSTTVRGETASIEMLELLLHHGTDLKNTGVAVAAADEGNMEALRLLLDHGVDTEDRHMFWYPFDEDRGEPDDSQGTALYRACRQGRLACVELLLDRGANAQAKDDGGMSCIEVARSRGHQDVVKLLEEMAVTDVQSESDSDTGQ